MRRKKPKGVHYFNRDQSTSILRVIYGPRGEDCFWIRIDGAQMPDTPGAVHFVKPAEAIKVCSLRELDEQFNMWL